MQGKWYTILQSNQKQLIIRETIWWAAQLSKIFLTKTLRIHLFFHFLSIFFSITLIQENLEGIFTIQLASMINKYTYLIHLIKYPILQIPNFNFPNLRCWKVFFFLSIIMSHIGIFDINLKLLSRKKLRIFGIRKIGFSMSWTR